MYLLWRVYYSSPKRVTDLFGRACIYCIHCYTARDSAVVVCCVVPFTHGTKARDQRGVTILTV